MRHGVAVFFLKHSANRLWQHFPQRFAEYGLAALLNNALSLIVEESKTPVAIHREKTIGDALHGDIQALREAFDFLCPTALVVHINGGTVPLQGLTVFIPHQ